MVETKNFVEDSTLEIHSDAPSEHQKDKKPEFFPYSDELEAQNISFPRLKRFPIVGAIGIVGSIATFGFSILVLLLCNNKELWVYPLLKPSAWLSIILSANSIFLRLAIAEGVNVSWWYRASKHQTTVGDLHNAWTHGTSLFSAISSGRSFSYVALATVFVATIPLNGLMLQNAIDVIPSIAEKHPNISMTLWTEFPLGYSATLNNDSTIGMLTPSWSYNSDRAIRSYTLDQRMKIDHFEDSGCFGQCYVTYRGVGFKETCSTYQIPYDLPINTSPNTTLSELTILDVKYGWNAAHPNTINLNTVFKPDSTCTGSLAVTNCTLEMATVDYYMEVEFVLQKNYGGNETWIIIPLYDAALNPVTEFVSSPNAKILPIHVGEGVTNSTYGGIVSALGTNFNSSLTFRQANGSSSFASQGGLAETYTFQLRDENSQPITENCAYATYSVPQSNNITGMALEIARATLMYTSILGARFAGDYDKATQYIAAQPAYISVNIYQVQYRWWGGSLALTFLIVCFILPTYWGWWDLTRKTTMSPAETARAFQAPVLAQASGGIDTKTLIKRVGTKRVNSDLAALSTEDKKDETAKVEEESEKAT